MTRRIAVINDNPYIVTAMQEALAAHGYDVERFFAAIGLREGLRRVHLDAIVMDIPLGGTDFHWRLLTGVASDPVLANAPIVLTMDDVPHAQERARTLQHRGFTILTRPVSPDDVVRAVHALTP